MLRDGKRICLIPVWAVYLLKPVASVEGSVTHKHSSFDVVTHLNPTLGLTAQPLAACVISFIHCEIGENFTTLVYFSQAALEMAPMSRGKQTHAGFPASTFKVLSVSSALVCDAGRLSLSC